MTLNNLPQIGISILVAAIVMTLGISVLMSMQDVQSDAVSSYRNVTLTWAGNNTKMGVGYSRIDTSAVTLWNDSKNALVENTDFTVNSDDTISVTNTSGWNYLLTNKLNATFRYYYGSYQRNATEYGVLGVDQLAQYVPTIALVAVAALIIGILVFMFGRTKPK